ncbi:MAG: HAD-IA family hydrolase, partial [Elusimicrobiaceae bacterium]|nr:HAD-IA family hydrolase [Elusimicrobiaceae bacterium]
MYLPEDFLTQVLHEKGFKGFEKLYVSNGPRKLKGSTTLYHYIQQELKLDPRTFLHIGDNKRSDVRCAKKAGWHALHCPALHTIFFQKHPHMEAFWHKHASFDASVTLGTLIIHAFSGTSTSSYFEKFGYRIGGPTAYGFARWIEKESMRANVKSLLFVARDGYTLHKVFETFDNTLIKSAYVYSLRFLNNIYRLDYRPTSRLEMQIILKYFAEKDPQLAHLASTDKLTAQQMHQLIQKNLPLIAPLAEQELANYRRYLSPYYTPNQMTGVVDSITGFFSSQKLIEAVVGLKNVIGLYWAVWHSDISKQHLFKMFLTEPANGDKYQILTYCWPVMEFIFTAPQPPIKQLSAQGVPSYDAVIPPQEQARIAAYQKVSS